MATAQQIQGYSAQWTPAAKSAGAQLGLPWQWILASWATEYGWTNGAQQGSNNPADLKALPGQAASAGGWANFSSTDAFVTEYVDTIRTDLSFYQKPPTGSFTLADVFGAFNAGEPYTASQSAASYAQAVASELSAYANALNTPVPATAKLGVKQLLQFTKGSPEYAAPGVVAAGEQAGQAVKGAASSAVSGVSAFAERWALAALGVVAVVLGLVLLVASSKQQLLAALVKKGGQAA